MRKKIIYSIIAIFVIFLMAFFLLPRKTAEEPTPESESNERIIILYSPSDGSNISSPLEVTGIARSNWFFEGDFPLILTDWDGRIIAQSYATAQSDWMTEAFVPFKGTIEFEKPTYGERGSLILQKDNPSGLPENDDALEITIFFE